MIRNDDANAHDRDGAAVHADEPADTGQPSLADLRARQEALLDEGVQETFPASDPVAVVRLI